MSCPGEFSSKLEIIRILGKISVYFEFSEKYKIVGFLEK